MDEQLTCISCKAPLMASTGKFQNNVWTVQCPACKAVNRLVPDPKLGGKLVASKPDPQK